MLDEITEDLETHNVLEEETPEVEEPLTAEQIAELKRNAEVSSQNFERAKKAENEKKELTEKLALLEAQLAGSMGDEYVEPNSAVFAKIEELNNKLNKIEEEKEFTALQSKYPVLGDKKAEFEAFKMDPENAGMKLQTAVRAFLAENDLMGEQPKRKGLEKAGGGTRVTAPAGKMSADDVKRLRETNWREYTKLLRNGQIQLAK